MDVHPLGGRPAVGPRAPTPGGRVWADPAHRSIEARRSAPSSGPRAGPQPAGAPGNSATRLLGLGLGHSAPGRAVSAPQRGRRLDRARLPLASQSRAQDIIISRICRAPRMFGTPVSLALGLAGAALLRLECACAAPKQIAQATGELARARTHARRGAAPAPSNKCARRRPLVRLPASRKPPEGNCTHASPCHRWSIGSTLASAFQILRSLGSVPLVRASSRGPPDSQRNARPSPAGPVPLVGGLAEVLAHPAAG